VKAIVTVKLPRNPRHDPHNKIAGKCPLSRILKTYVYCTDVTGSHHSYIEEGLSLKEIKEKAKKKFQHITRVEACDEWSE